MAETALVYVCSPDRERHVFHSLAGALRWGKTVDRFIIFCVGEPPAHWKFRDPRVEVRSVPPMYGDYFYGNKLYACDVDCDRVLFLDADTLVLSPLERLWAGWSQDFRGRPANGNWAARWNHHAWQEAFRRHDVPPVPMFNAGVLLFQNGAHRRLRAAWRACMEDYLAGRLPEPLPLEGFQSEQWGLSLALRLEKASLAIMGPIEHTFGWLGEPVLDTVVLHTSNAAYREDDGTHSYSDEDRARNLPYNHFERFLIKLGVELPADLLG